MPHERRTRLFRGVGREAVLLHLVSNERGPPGEVRPSGWGWREPLADYGCLIDFDDILLRPPFR